MKKCERKDCGGYTEIVHENHCITTEDVPARDCPYFMTIEERAKVERMIRRRSSGVGAKTKEAPISGN